MQMILLGAPISADEALSAGLVSQLFEAGTVLENAIKIASSLAALSPTALSLAKEAVSRCGLSSDLKKPQMCTLFAHKLFFSQRMNLGATMSLNVRCTTLLLGQRTSRRASMPFWRSEAPFGSASKVFGIVISISYAGMCIGSLAENTSLVSITDGVRAVSSIPGWHGGIPGTRNKFDSSIDTCRRNTRLARAPTKCFVCSIHTVPTVVSLSSMHLEATR